MRRAGGIALAALIVAGVLQLARPAAAVLSTERVADAVAGATGSDPRYLEVMGSYVYFSADDGTHGRELFRSDGTSVQLVKDIVLGPGASSPQELTAVGNTLFFTARTPTQGRELWKSDGTEAGTVIVHDLAFGTASGLEDFDVGAGLDPHLTAVGTIVVFEGAADNNGLDKQLWFALPEGVGPIYDFSPIANDTTPIDVKAIVPSGIGNAFYVSLDCCNEGREVYYWNGSPGMPVLQEVADGPDSGGPELTRDMAVTGGTLYFRGDDGTGDKLWKTSGSGATLAADGSDVDELVVAGGKVFFEDPDPSDSFTNELWVHDPAGAALNKTKLTSLSSSGAFSEVAYGNDVLFGGSDGTTGDYLWKTDGTLAGTVKIERFQPNGGAGSEPVVSNGLAYVPASTGSDLWVSDGTAHGTFELTDMTSGESGPAFGPVFVTAAPTGGVFFSASQSGGGNELYRTLDAQPDHPLSSGVNGPGKITSIPRGIDCGTDCSRRFPADDVVDLYAEPYPGETFTGWGGACSGTDPNSCHVTMSESRFVGAGFSGQQPPTEPSVATLSINDVSTKEGKKGKTKLLTFTVTLTGNAPGGVTAHWQSFDGTAVSPKDYTGANGDVSMAGTNGASDQIQLTIRGDRKKEKNETFTVQLSSPNNADIDKGIGVGTIKNDDH